MIGLTDKQREVLRFIAESVRDKGMAPTIREICDHRGTSSTNAANDMLVSLERKGMLVRAEMVSRGLTLTEAGWAESGVPRVPVRRIVVTRRADDYQAAIEGEPGKWGCGTGASAAIGDMLTTWGAVLGIEIVTAEVSS